MEASRQPWPGSVRATSNLGSLAVLGDSVVAREVTVILTGDQEPPPGKRWPDATLRFEIRDGAANCIDIRITSKPGDRPLRSVTITEYQVESLAEFGFGQIVGRRVSGESAMTVASQSAERPVEVRRAVRASYGDPMAELREVARIYLDPGARGKPTESVWRVMNYGSRETTSRRIKAARARGLIPEVGASEHELDSAFQRVIELIERKEGHGEAI